MVMRELVHACVHLVKTYASRTLEYFVALLVLAGAQRWIQFDPVEESSYLNCDIRRSWSAHYR
jgi:hypothetical protein